MEGYYDISRLKHHQSVSSPSVYFFTLVFPVYVFCQKSSQFISLFLCHKYSFEFARPHSFLLYLIDKNTAISYIQLSCFVVHKTLHSADIAIVNMSSILDAFVLGFEQYSRLVRFRITWLLNSNK